MFNNSKDIFFELEEARKNGANILMPSTKIGGLSEFHQPVIDYVTISPNAEDDDVYPDKQSGKFRFTKQALMKLSVCAGMIWHPIETKRVDNRADRNYCAYQAVGGIRKADGQPVYFKAEYDMDFEVIEEELIAQYSAKSFNGTAEKKEAWVKEKVRSDILFKRKHKVKLCEAGAMNRVIRALLGLKNGYTREELSKPFVMVRVVIRPDYTDPDTRRQMLAAAVKSMTGMYGGDFSAGQFDAIPAAIDVTHYDEPPMPVEPEDNPPEDNHRNEEHPKASARLEEQLIDFSNCDAEEQIATLSVLMAHKNYSIDNLKKPLVEFTEKNRVGLFQKLVAMPDAPATTTALAF